MLHPSAPRLLGGADGAAAPFALHPAAEPQVFYAGPLIDEAGLAATGAAQRASERARAHMAAMLAAFLLGMLLVFCVTFGAMAHVAAAARRRAEELEALGAVADDDDSANGGKRAALYGAAAAAWRRLRRAARARSSLNGGASAGELGNGSPTQPPNGAVAVDIAGPRRAPPAANGGCGGGAGGNDLRAAARSVAGAPPSFVFRNASSAALGQPPASFVSGRAGPLGTASFVGGSAPSARANGVLPLAASGSDDVLAPLPPMRRSSAGGGTAAFAADFAAFAPQEPGEAPFWTSGPSASCAAPPRLPSMPAASALPAAAAVPAMAPPAHAASDAPPSPSTDLAATASGAAGARAPYVPGQTRVLHAALEYSLPHLGLETELMFGGLGMVRAAPAPPWHK